MPVGPAGGGQLRYSAAVLPFPSFSLGHRAYVYYRVAPADVPACLQAVQALQQQWAARHPGLQAQLLVKQAPPATDSPSSPDAARPTRTTLMEIYAWGPAVPGAEPPDAAALEAALSACTARWIDGARHVEVFAPCV